MIVTLQSLTLSPIKLPAGGRLRKELKAHRWAIRFHEFMGTIHKETEEKHPEAFGQNEKD